MGRPKKGALGLTERLTVRMRAEERVDLGRRAEAAGEPDTSAYARSLLVQSPTITVRAVRTKADPELIIALNRIGTNLNQIARSLNSNLGFVPQNLDDALRRVNEYLDKAQK